MAILIGCEESQVICGEFRKAGYTAFSCDLMQTRGKPAWHIQKDIMKVIPIQKWDLIILHPDCTALAVSGNETYATGKSKHKERGKAVEWTIKLWELALQCSEHVALENPVSVLFPILREHQSKPKVFYLQPWQHGHGETKRTGFALYGLKPLVPTNIVKGRKQKMWLMGPSPTRKRDRSITYTGVAKAIVDQWGKQI